MTEEKAKELQDLYNDYLNVPKDQLIELGKKYFNRIYNKFLEVTKNEENARRFALVCFGAFAKEDGDFNAYEWMMFEGIKERSLSYQEALKMIEDELDNTYKEGLKTVVDCDPEMKNIIIRFGLCICAIDGNIDYYENKLIIFLLDL